MDYGSAYDSILDDTQCPECGHVGMVSDGSYEYECPECGYHGYMGDEED